MCLFDYTGSQAENKENLTAVPEHLDMEGVSIDKENMCTQLNTAVPTTSAADTTTVPVISTDMHGSMPVTSMSEEEEYEREKQEMYRGEHRQIEPIHTCFVVGLRLLLAPPNPWVNLSSHTCLFVCLFVSLLVFQK